MVIEQSDVVRRAAFRVRRSRGAITAILIVLLGAWSILIPFIGPSFHFGYTPKNSWTWTRSRALLELLPGAAAMLGGLLLLMSARRAGKSLGSVLATIAGAWLIIGIELAPSLHLGAVGVPLGAGSWRHALETLSLFTGLGGVVTILAAHAAGALSVRSLGDIRSAERSLEHEHTQAIWKQESAAIAPAVASSHSANISSSPPPPASVATPVPEPRRQPQPTSAANGQIRADE